MDLSGPELVKQKCWSIDFNVITQLQDDKKNKGRTEFGKFGRMEKKQHKEGETSG